MVLSDSIKEPATLQLLQVLGYPSENWRWNPAQALNEFSKVAPRKTLFPVAPVKQIVQQHNGTRCKVIKLRVMLWSNEVLHINDDSAPVTYNN